MISQLLCLLLFYAAIETQAQTVATSTSSSIILIDPMLDGRKEIAKYNKFMDEIFSRMNAAIKAKNLDPMDLKLLPTTKSADKKMPRSQPQLYDVKKVKAWLYGMSSLKRTGDVSIFFHTNHKTIQCPFSLGPLELRVIKNLDGSSKTAKAETEIMLGLMDLRIDKASGQADITDVYFDEPGGVSVTGNLRRRAHLKHNTNGYSPYRLALASRAAVGLKKVARLVVASDNNK